MRPHRLAASFVGALLTSCSLLLDTNGLGPGAGDDDGRDGATSTDGGGASEDGGREDATSDAGPRTYFDEVKSDRPILYLRLGEGSRSAGAKDESGAFSGTYSATGISLGAAGALTGDPDSAITLTDGNGSIAMPSGATFDGATPFTAEIWFRAAPGNSLLGYIIDHQSAAPRRGWLLRAGTSDVSFERARDDGNVDPAYAASPPAGVWHHLVGVFDGTLQCVYLDGVLKKASEAVKAKTIIDSAAPYRIGHATTASDPYGSFVGDLDELAIYDAALQPGRIRAHYEAAKR